MKYSFFSIPANAPEGAQEALNGFCAGRRVVNVDKQFVAAAERSFWAVCVCYLDGDAPKSTAAGRKGKVDYREVLNPDDFAVYAELRTLRKTVAERDGVPLYNVFTNDQLAAIVERRLSSKADLAAIDGLGEIRIEKYGDLFLAARAEAAQKRAPGANPAKDAATEPPAGT